MTGFFWIAATWGLTGYVLMRILRRRPGGWPLSPLLAGCVVLLMLGTQSAETDASTASSAIGLDTVLRGFLASAALVFAVRVLLVNGHEGRARLNRGRINLAVLSMYATIAALSTLYSVDPIQTAGKAYELGVAVIVAWAIATSRNARQQLAAAVELIVVLWSAMLIVAIPGFFLLPSQFVLSTDGRPGFIFASTMAAPYAHSNGLSAIGAVLAAYAIAKGLHTPSPEIRRRWYWLAGVGSVAILLASGRQGVIIWAAGVGLVLFLYARPMFVFGLIPATAFVVYEFGATLWTALTRQQQDVTLYTLSGRLDFWDAAITAWRDSPVLGYGFGVGGRLVALASIGEGEIGSLHSGYFEALVGVGLIGVVTLLIVVLRVVRWSWIHLHRGVSAHLGILIVPLLLHTAISLGFAAWLSSQFMVLAFLAAYADLAPLRESREPVAHRGAYPPRTVAYTAPAR